MGLLEHLKVAPRELRICHLKMANSIHRIVKSISYIRLYFISPKSWLQRAAKRAPGRRRTGWIGASSRGLAGCGSRCRSLRRRKAPPEGGRCAAKALHLTRRVAAVASKRPAPISAIRVERTCTCASGKCISLRMQMNHMAATREAA